MRCASLAVTMSSDFTVEGVDVRTLPKVSLHDHLDGSLRPSTILELAEVEGIEVPAVTAEDLGAWFETQSNAGSLVEYLKTFDLTCAADLHTGQGVGYSHTQIVVAVHRPDSPV